jgi:hypothetical protein
MGLTQVVTAAAVTLGCALAAGCSGSGGATGGSTGPAPFAGAAGASAGTSATTSPSPAATSSGEQPATAPPAGYRWDGSPTQGIWVAIPQTWVALNLAKLSLHQATRRFATTGVDTAAMQADLANLKKQGALFFADLASYAKSKHSFTTNASAFCPATGAVPAGTSIPDLEAEMRAEYSSIKARVLSVSPATVAGGQAFQAKLILTSTSGYDITELQVVILSTAGQTCFVTFSTDNPASFAPTFAKAAASIHVG